jgi:hypothetical protein
MNWHALQALIRSRMLSGALPSRDEHELLGSKGDGRICACCAASIIQEQVQYEVKVPTAYGVSMSFAMHVACYDAWRAECRGAK